MEPLPAWLEPQRLLDIGEAPNGGHDAAAALRATASWPAAPASAAAAAAVALGPVWLIFSPDSVARLAAFAARVCSDPALTMWRLSAAPSSQPPLSTPGCGGAPVTISVATPVVRAVLGVQCASGSGHWAPEAAALTLAPPSNGAPLVVLHASGGGGGGERRLAMEASSMMLDLCMATRGERAKGGEEEGRRREGAGWLHALPLLRAAEEAGQPVSLEVVVHGSKSSGDGGGSGSKHLQLAAALAEATRRRGGGGLGIAGPGATFSAAAAEQLAEVEAADAVLRKAVLASAVVMTAAAVPRLELVASPAAAHAAGALARGLSGAVASHGPGPPTASASTMAAALSSTLALRADHVVLALDLAEMAGGDSSDGKGEEGGRTQTEAAAFQRPQWGRGWTGLRVAAAGLDLCATAAPGGVAGARHVWLSVGEYAVYGGRRRPAVGGEAWWWLTGEEAGRREAAEERGRSREAGERELFACRAACLGRGAGGGAAGGNVLSVGTAGVALAYTELPNGGGNAVLALTVRGGTASAPGGRLDWLLALAGFAQKASTAFANARPGDEGGGSPGPSRPPSSPPISPSSSTNVFLNLHDVGLCYWPGPEAAAAAAARLGASSKPALKPVTLVTACSSTAAAAAAAAPCRPVACMLLVAAVRVVGQLPGAFGSNMAADKEGTVPALRFEVWLRDAAMHVLDLAVRKTPADRRSLAPDGWSAAAMAARGFVQVAREGVMEACVQSRATGGGGGGAPQWELECANNQLRLDTCCDTAAAVAGLGGQLQQLLAPDPAAASMTMVAPSLRSSGDGSGSREAAASSAGSLPAALAERPRRAEGGGRSEAAAAAVEAAMAAVLAAVPMATETWEVLTAVEPVALPKHVPAAMASDGGGCCSSGRTARQQPLAGPMFIEDYYEAAPAVSPAADGGAPGPPSRPAAALAGGGNRRASVGMRQSEQCAEWYSGRAAEVRPDHVPVAPVREQEPQSGGLGVSGADGSGAQRGGGGGGSGGGGGGGMVLAAKFPPSAARVVLRDLSLRWRLYGGRDWPDSSAPAADPAVSAADSAVNAAAADAASDGVSSCRASRGRQQDVCMEVQLAGVHLQHDAFPAGGLYASRLAVGVRDVGVYDCSAAATWRLVLGPHRVSGRPREPAARALRLEMEAVRPDQRSLLEEYRLRVALLPIRLHLDQRHIDFCRDFFAPPPPPAAAGGAAAPMGGYGCASTNGSEDLTTVIAEEALLPFFQVCELRPITVRVDYLPRRINLRALRGGNYGELLNFVRWQGVELQLKRVRIVGAAGWEALGGAFLGEWLEHVAATQVHKFVRGVSTIRPLYALGEGAAALVSLPAEQYRRDRRLLRGMRKGAVAFVRSVSLEALGLGAQLAAGTHDLLQHAEVALGRGLGTAQLPGAVAPPGGGDQGRALAKRLAMLPLQACESLSRGLEKTALSLVGNPVKAYQRGAGVATSLGVALKAVPTAVIVPASAAASALSSALLGVRNEIDPEHKREQDEKHAGPPGRRMT
eukprot:SM000261S09959  [mRNA]  locus=s261:40005:47019:+ [translate_table: standard]